MNPKQPRLLSVGAAVMGLLGGAAPSGLLVPGIELQAAQPTWRRRDEEDSRDELLLVVPPTSGQILLAGHRSHSSHRSHYSGRGSRSRSYGGGYYVPASDPEPPPPPPKPASVFFVAYPGGRIFVDGKPAGLDVTVVMKLPAGKHTVRVENEFIGATTVEVNLVAGQTGNVTIEW
ncbi:PEGA domain-containing protein [Myxococcus stipitatus]|uniref:PEGA domain-containing protein n=1 Tax=Myxococcus stipitatus TaxID=83455 RepID=UPI0030CA8479